MDRVLGLARDRWALVGMLSVLGIVAFIPLRIGFTTWSDHQALKDEWRIAGPPCPPSARLWPVGPIKPKRFHYRDASFERRYGGAYCEAIPDDGLLKDTSHTVCQFSNPGQLTVVTAAATSRWEPGVGRRATVTIHDRRASCVVGGWFD